MSQKQGSSKKARTPKKSAGINSGGGKVRLDELQKVLLVSGGMGHYLRGGKVRRPSEGPGSAARPKRDEF